MMEDMEDESKELSLIYEFIHEHFDRFMESDTDATDKMYKILTIIKGGDPKK